MAGPARSEELARKQREARSKKLLLLLVPVLIGLAVFQGPRLMKQFDKAKETTEEVQGQVVQGFEELAPNGVPAETAPLGAPADPAIAALAAAEGLPDTDVPLEAGESELVSFTRFEPRDPFVQLVDDATEEDASETTDSSGDTSTDTSADSGTDDSTSSSSDADDSGYDDSGTYDSGYDDSTGDTDSSDSGDTASQVTITVNGDVIVVAVGDTFPAADPAFKVVAIEGNVVKIGLASGSFSNGVDTLDLEVGESVTLISQPDGARFTIKITSLG